MSVCRSRHWACAHCGHAIVDHSDAWTIEFATRPWIHVVHDECLDAYNAASTTPPTFDKHEPTVCAGTGNHDGQGITSCDECAWEDLGKYVAEDADNAAVLNAADDAGFATFIIDLDAMERDPLLHP